MRKRELTNIGSSPHSTTGIELKMEEKSHGKNVQKMQNLLKKGRANLSRSKSELGEHNRRIIQQISRHRSELGQQNRRLLASFRLKAGA